MAEETKKVTKSQDSWLTWVSFFIMVFVIVGVWWWLLENGRVDQTLEETGEMEEVGESEEIKESFYDIYSWFGRDDLVLGARIINTKDVPVRTLPGGSIIGTQEKLETGKLMEGPLTQFGTYWWRVDYPEAPDGWIQYDQISADIGAVRTINAVPFLYGFYEPIGYSLIFILFLIILYIRLKLKREEKIADKKIQISIEQTINPLEVKRQNMSEVQKLPGFQTEEIVPVVKAERDGRWEHIQGLMESYNENDWKQAIIEADIILEEMLQKMGYEGTSIGDMLKKVERSDFVNLDKAWSAHKVRNQIAHKGSFKIRKQVAEQAINDFEAVFKEFYYI